MVLIEIISKSLYSRKTYYIIDKKTYLRLQKEIPRICMYGMFQIHNEEGVSEEFSVLLMKKNTQKKTGEWLIWHSVL